MRLFLWEDLTCGACAAVPPSLAVEGAAMLRALAADAVAVPGWEVVAAWNTQSEPFGVPGVRVCAAQTAAAEQTLFCAAAAQADVTCIIAPEFGARLASRQRLIEQVGGTSAGSTVAAIKLCADKLALAAHLGQCGVPTVPTQRCAFHNVTIPAAGVIVKPRYGAGSLNTFHCRTPAELAAAAKAFAADSIAGEPLVQPFVAGAAVSVAAVVGAGGTTLFPVGRQRMGRTPQLHYRGGFVPARSADSGAVAAVAQAALMAVPGLRGYVGVDLIVSGTDGPQVLEINPRLTTAYLGYRCLTQDNLALRLLTPDVPRPAIVWQPGRVAFRPDGRTQMFREQPIAGRRQCGN